MALTVVNITGNEFGYAELRFATTCFDEALIEGALLTHWKWTECNFWDGCGLDGGSWKEVGEKKWHPHDHKSWCLSDDQNDWKQFTTCGSQCYSECEEGWNVRHKECVSTMLFHS